jgi:hypothetical protein
MKDDDDDDQLVGDDDPTFKFSGAGVVKTDSNLRKFSKRSCISAVSADLNFVNLFDISKPDNVTQCAAISGP